MSMGAALDMCTPESNLDGQQGYALMNQSLTKVIMQNETRKLINGQRETFMANLTIQKNKSQSSILNQDALS